ncbi:LysR family transcriptional regulator [Nakamurella sp.]|uniref:LysR family transcriptional regulator n=1 Tax=Nakamurella sp. TaxID=1869182 RepID=UPI003B3A76DD
MEVHQLQILRELGALGSVSAVAKVLNVSPSAVSQHLTALQRSFSTPLTAKQGRTLTLTDAGQVLADAGAEVIDAMAAARTAVETFEQSAGGTVAVSGFHSAGQSLFGLLLQELARLPTAPDVRLTDEDVPRQDFPGLTARYDLVIAHRLDHSPAWPAAGLRTITLVREPLDVALPVDHPLAGDAELTADQVAGERWVTTRGGYSPDDLLDAVAAVSGRQLTVVHRINDYGTVHSIVAAGHAIGLVPRYTSPLAPPGSIVLRPLTGIGARRTIDLLTRPENLRRRSVRVVAQALNRVVAGIIRERQ